MCSSFLSFTEVPTLHADPLKIESHTVKSAKAVGLSAPRGPKAPISATVCVPVGLGQAAASTISASAAYSKIFGCGSLFHFRQSSGAWRSLHQLFTWMGLSISAVSNLLQIVFQGLHFHIYPKQRVLTYNFGAIYNDLEQGILPTHVIAMDTEALQSDRPIHSSGVANTDERL
jgi:hypothetical protein